MPGVLQRPAVVSRISDLIGYTPLLELATTETGNRLLLKLEMFNPTGTAKIRMARAMIDAAEAAGELRSGGRIIESTSGNTGLGLSVIAAERGYTFTAVVDHHAAADKLRTMKVLGAELVYVDDDSPGEELHTAAREELAEDMARDQDNTIFTEQHNNPANGVGYFPVAHELAEALDGRIDILIGAVGTGGGLCGTGRELSKLITGFTTIGVEPKGSIAFGGPAHDYHQSGTGTPEGAEIGALVDFDLIDEGVKVGDIEAFATCRAVARTGLLIGGSAGGVVHEALTRLPLLPPGATMVALINDGGEKYMDTVFNDNWMAERNLLDPTLEREVEERLTKLRRNR
ncbi:cysteine synthase family protein [Streptomyces nodosus]|uniref:Cysteine synthase n=1 Tax=Streptomyces nodosus TaxID=40318 RepID=A0A0B5DCG2_9ACTN|nr:cysteine synthase family protein [Streptomyces nodosus]AJE38905.1 cysteine synthase [Streptomyces nodosus]MBB4789716.1 cystathionine beta-synthase [Streptomyces nodosus]QEV37488.1 cysteine synthase family protein [Streptomyces nodosus]